MGWIYIDGILVPNHPDLIAQWEEEHRPDDWIPKYSTDIGAAWTIVEKLKESDAKGEEGFTLDYDDWHKIWRADFGYTSCVSDTATLSICRSAIKRVEVKKSKHAIYSPNF